MAATSDVLMMLVKGGSSLSGESQTLLGSRDQLLKGPPKFEEGKFFDLENFSFTLAAQPSDSGDASKQAPYVAVFAGGNRPATAVGQRHGPTSKWNPAHLDRVSCTRQVDHASPVLFQECGLGTVFDSASVVRRKVIGGGLSTLASRNKDDHTNHLMTYVRIDFFKVTITEVGWNSEDDGVRETLQFVCDEAHVYYRQQMHTGDVQAKPRPPGKWHK